MFCAHCDSELTIVRSTAETALMYIGSAGLGLGSLGMMWRIVTGSAPVPDLVLAAFFGVAIVGWGGLLVVSTSRQHYVAVKATSPAGTKTGHAS